MPQRRLIASWPQWKIKLKPFHRKNRRNAHPCALQKPGPPANCCFSAQVHFIPFFFVATFLPFLVFFMLAGKPQIWKVTMELFPPGNRKRVKEALDQVNIMRRTYLAGHALVALIL